MTDPAKMLSLVADVGGTNTRVALADGTVLRPASVSRFKNAEFPGLGAVLAAYLAEQGHPDCDAVCAALAGPVGENEGRLTNLDWQIDCITLAEAAQAEHSALLNDLQAQGYGITHIAEEKLREVLVGEDPARDTATKLVVGIGTGFNAAAVFAVPGGHLVTPSEAGHASLPVQTEADLSLSQFAAQAHGFADVEEVLSGRGLETVFAWVTQTSGAPQRKSAAEIAQGFQNGDDAMSREAARAFARMMGIVAGDLALVHLPYGGLYLAGGVARAFAPMLTELGFSEAFLGKGRFSDLMTAFPVHVIEDDFAALSGCAGYLCQQVAQGQSAQ